MLFLLTAFLQLINSTGINFLHLTVSTILPGQDFQTQGHYGKVKSRSDHDVAHLHFLTNVSINF